MFVYLGERSARSISVVLWRQGTTSKAPYVVSLSYLPYGTSYKLGLRNLQCISGTQLDSGTVESTEEPQVRLCVLEFAAGVSNRRAVHVLSVCTRGTRFAPWLA